jgi:hypothetical protein
MDDRDEDGHTHSAVYERACRRVTLVDGGLAEPKIDRHEHQSRAVRNRHDEGPERLLRRSYSCQHPRMAAVDEPQDPEADDQQAGADLDLSLPCDKGDA